MTEPAKMNDTETRRHGDTETRSRAVSYPCLLVSRSPCLRRQLRTFSKSVRFAAVIGAAALIGCGKTEPPPFRLDMTNVVAKQIAPRHQNDIANILAAMFGTPDVPFAMPETGLNQRMLEMAAGPVWSEED